MGKIRHKPGTHYSDTLYDQEGYMRKTLRWLLVVLSFSVAALALGSILFSLGELRNSGERASGAEYSIIRNALTGIRTKEDLKDDFLRQRLIALYKGSDRLLAVQVLDSSGLVLWRLPGDSSYFALPGNPSSRAGFSAPDLSTVVFTTPLNNGMKLVTLFATLRKADMAQAIKTPLIFLALWFGLMIAAFFVFGNDKVERKSAQESAGEPEAEKQSKEKEAEAQSQEPEQAPEIALIAESEAGQQEDVPVQSGDSMGEAPGEEESRPVQEAEATVPDENAEAKPNNSTALLYDQEIIEPQKPQEFDQTEEEEFFGEEDSIEEAEAEASFGAPRKNFEESLARLEEEIATWSSKHGDLKTPPPSAEDAAKTEEIQETQDFIESLEAEEELAELEALSKSENADEKPAAPAALEKEPPSLAPELPVSSPGANLASLPLPLSLIDSELESKLREELDRSPKAEVSLMLIHCSVNSASDPAALALAVTVRDYIGAKDLIFELYKGAFAVVLPSVDLGGSLKMSEDLADVLSATLGLYRDIEGDAPGYIGISARSERRVDAFKLYREASTALHKAYEGSQSRILAFRPKSE